VEERHAIGGLGKIKEENHNNDHGRDIQRTGTEHTPEGIEMGRKVIGTLWHRESADLLLLECGTGRAQICCC